MSEKNCQTCNTSITNDSGKTEFNCPQCNNETITRCKNCRLNAVKYSCKKCNFGGPN